MHLQAKHARLSPRALPFWEEPAAERRALPSLTTTQKTNKQINFPIWQEMSIQTCSFLRPAPHFISSAKKTNKKTNKNNPEPITWALLTCCLCVWTFNIVARSECVPQEEAALCSSAEGIYSLFYSCSSSPDWLWQGGDEGEELFSSAGSSIIPVTPNRQKESSRGNLPSVSSGRRRRRRGGRWRRGKEGKKRRAKNY